jgi:hypothetical protein
VLLVARRLSVGVEHLDATIRLLDQQVSSGGPAASPT